MEIDLALVPKREVGMTPYEIMLSESQERMLIIVHKGKEHVVKEIFEKWDLPYAEVGSVMDDGMMRVRNNGTVVAEIPARKLSGTIDAPDTPSPSTTGTTVINSARAPAISSALIVNSTDRAPPHRVAIRVRHRTGSSQRRACRRCPSADDLLSSGIKLQNPFRTSSMRENPVIASAAEFGEGAKVPVAWLVAANDSYFPPDLSKQMADAFRKGGDKVDFRVLPAFRSEGHWLAETDGAEKIFGPVLESGFKPAAAKQAKKK